MSDEFPDLRRAIRGLAKNEILIPTLHTALNDPKFKGFNIEIEPWSARPPDGYFHPSTQATWNVRQLALYLMAPEMVETERMQLTSVLAITQGHFWHLFIQHVLAESKILIKSEVGFTDELHKRRGHMDGLLRVNGREEGLEIKTMNPYKIKKVTSAQELILEKPEYWAQAQEYLDVFGLDQMRFLIISPSYPFPMNEFVVPADPEHQERRRAIYRGAIQVADNATLPLPDQGCCGREDICPVSYACKGH